MRKACLAESNVDEKYVIASKNGNLPDVPELKCYVLCILEHTGMINSDDEIDFDPILHLLTPTFRGTAERVTAACKTKRKHTYSIIFVGEKKIIESQLKLE